MEKVMKSYRISYFKRFVGEVEYIGSYINKKVAKSVALTMLNIDEYDLNKSVKEQMKELEIKDFKVELIK